MIKMNKTIKKLWVTALKGKAYKQGQGKLRNRDNEYCCLGVLCDVHRLEVREETWAESQYGYNYFFGSTYLPDEIVQWAGLDSKNPIVDGESLANLNDVGKLSFKAIAKIIEENL